MELRQLAHFLAVMDAGTVGDAARRLKISQPALTRSIQALERSLGANLFTRSRSGTIPTEFAHAIELRARTIAMEALHTESAIRELLLLQRGRVSIGTSPIFSERILTEAIARFRQANPAIEVSVFVGGISATILEATMGKLDFALCSFPSHPLSPDLMTEALLKNYRTGVYTSAKHPLAARRHVAPSELLSYPWLLPTRSESIRAKLNQRFAQAGLSPPEAAVEYGTIAMATELLQKGPYIALMSDIIFGDLLKAGVVKIVRAPKLNWRATAGAIYRRNVPLMPAARKLLDVIGVVSAEIQRAAS